MVRTSENCTNSMVYSEFTTSSQGLTKVNYYESLLIYKVSIRRREQLCQKSGNWLNTMTAGTKESIQMAENLYGRDLYGRSRKRGFGCLRPPLHVIGKRYLREAFDWRNKQNWWMCLVMTLYWFSNIAFNAFLRNKGNKSSFHWNMHTSPSLSI